MLALPWRPLHPADPQEFRPDLFHHCPPEAYPAIRLIWPFLRTHVQRGQVVDRYIVRLSQPSLGDGKEALTTALSDVLWQGRVNFSFALLLQNKSDENDYRAFYGSSNNSYFARPVYLRSKSDFYAIAESLNGLQIIEHLAQQVPSSKWRVRAVLGLNVVVTKFSTRIF